MTSQLSMFVSQGKWMPFHRHFVHFSPSTHFFSLHTPKKIHASVATQKGTTCLPSSHSINFPAFFSLKKKKLNCQKRSEFKRRVGSFEPPFSIFSNKSFSSLGTKRILFFLSVTFWSSSRKMLLFFRVRGHDQRPGTFSFIIWSVKQPPGQIQCQG